MMTNRDTVARDKAAASRAADYYSLIADRLHGEDELAAKGLHRAFAAVKFYRLRHHVSKRLGKAQAQASQIARVRHNVPDWREVA